jgi:hypothetical protein
VKAGPDVPDRTLERYRLGELRAAESAQLREAIATEESLRRRLEALEASDAEILAAHPADTFAAEVRRRAAAEDVRPIRRTVWAPAVATTVVMAAAGLWMARGVGNGGGEPPLEDRLKGGAPQIFVYRKGEEIAAQRLASGATARADDVVQLAYQSGGRRYGVIVSVDGRGAVTRHLPVSGEAAAPLREGAAVALGTAFRLDDAPRLERFYLAAGNAPFAVEEVVAAAAAASDLLTTERLPLREDLAQATFLLRKE